MPEHSVSLSPGTAHRVTVTALPPPGSSAAPQLVADSARAPEAVMTLHESGAKRYPDRYYFGAACLADVPLTPAPGTPASAFAPPQDKTSYCPYKGTARYHDVGSAAPAAAWSYPDGEHGLQDIADKVCFWTMGSDARLQLHVDGQLRDD